MRLSAETRPSPIHETAAIDCIHGRYRARFEKVFLFVEQHLGADLKVADLARAYGSGLHSFSVAFRRTMGFATKAYVDRRLNEEVIRRLINTDAPAKAIVADLRFSNEYYFSRFCTRMNGHLPARLCRSLLTKYGRRAEWV